MRRIARYPYTAAQQTSSCAFPGAALGRSMRLTWVVTAARELWFATRMAGRRLAQLAFQSAADSRETRSRDDSRVGIEALVLLHS